MVEFERMRNRIPKSGIPGMHAPTPPELEGERSDPLGFMRKLLRASNPFNKELK